MRADLEQAIRESRTHVEHPNPRGLQEAAAKAEEGTTMNTDTKHTFTPGQRVRMTSPAWQGAEATVTDATDPENPEVRIETGDRYGAVMEVRAWAIEPVNTDLRPPAPTIEKPLAPLSDDGGWYQVYRVGEVKIDTWVFAHSGSRDVDVYAHGFEAGARKGDDYHCVHFTHRDDDETTTVRAFIDREQAIKLRDDLIAMDLDPERW